jgi:hypothetical protein
VADKHFLGTACAQVNRQHAEKLKKQQERDTIFLGKLGVEKSPATVRFTDLPPEVCKYSWEVYLDGVKGAKDRKSRLVPDRTLNRARDSREIPDISARFKLWSEDPDNVLFVDSGDVLSETLAFETLSVTYVSG